MRSMTGILAGMPPDRRDAALSYEGPVASGERTGPVPGAGLRLRDATWRLAVLLARHGRRHYPVTLATAAGKQARLDGVRVEEGPPAPEWLARAWFRGWCQAA